MEISTAFVSLGGVLIGAAIAWWAAHDAAHIQVAAARQIARNAARRAAREAHVTHIREYVQSVATFCGGG
jgi:hypothetical protein